MMEPRYYYSRDGNEINGPVSKVDLRQLLETKTLDSTSYLCLEGNNQWEQLKPEIFQEESPSLPSQTSSGTRRKRTKFKWYSDEGLVDPDRQKKFVSIFWCVALAGAAIGVHLRYVAFSAIQPPPDSFLDVVAYFLAAVLVIMVPACIFSMVLPYPRRRLARAIGVICFAVLFLSLRYSTLATSIAETKSPPPSALKQ